MADRDLQLFINWGVWGHLDRHKEMELIILKGHLLLEVVLADEVSDNKLSFHGKVNKYRKLGRNQQIADSLHDLNQMRNKIAHEWKFNAEEIGVEDWAASILDTFEPRLFTKRTYRTKIVHGFSTLANELYGSIEGFDGAPAVQKNKQ